MLNYNSPARRFSLPAFVSAGADAVGGETMSATLANDVITDATTALVVTEREVYSEYLSTSVRDLGDDIVSLTLSRHFMEAGEWAEDFGLNQYASVFVSRAQARAFAELILEQLGGAGA